MHSGRRAFVVGLLALAACGKGKDSKGAAGGGAAAGGAATGGMAGPTGGSAPAAVGATYFDVTIDGKPVAFPIDEVHATFTKINNHPRFSIYAGADDAPSLLLTIPRPMTGPTTVPSGSPEITDNIIQGSVSLQNYPQKNYTTNSFDTMNPPEAAVVQPDAITISEITPAGADATYVAGSINVKTFGADGGTDPKATDHVIKGRFRIRHVFDSMSGERF